MSGRRSGGRAARLRALDGAEPLVEKGAPNYTTVPGPEKVCVIACGALAHETLDIIRLNGLDHIALTCLPAKLHNAPEDIAPAVERAIQDARTAGFEQIYCGYADCGTGGALDRVLAREGVERLPGAHCYQFFSGVDAFAAREQDDLRAFFLTDFLARHFDGLTWGPLGLEDHPDLRDMYFGNYEKVVFLSQKNDPDLLARAREIADRLGLSFDHRPTGYGDLETSLSGLRAE
ncbi:MAG: DUF1638 domain-containing protein [Pseudomonadota bacterium]